MDHEKTTVLVFTLVTVADFSVYSGQKLVTEFRGGISRL